jgi:hypothetical protein
MKLEKCAPGFSLLILLFAGEAFAQNSEPASVAQDKKGSWWRRVATPFRPSPWPYVSGNPCGLGYAHCFSVTPAGDANSELAPIPPTDETTGARKVLLWKRTDGRGPIAHHWLEMETSIGVVTLGFGPATVPFIDSGQISLQDSYGNIVRISGAHPIPPLTLPPVNYRYARRPGEGKVDGKPIEITLHQANEIVRKNRDRKFIFPYVPIFNDCRTFACKTQERAKGRSGVLCHLLLKGYW